MRKIMIVDDELLVRVGIKSIVEWEEFGYTIIAEAASGREALEKIRARQPDIVLTDLVMEDMNGFELIAACSWEYPQIRFVVLSSYNDFDNVRRAMKLGAADYFFKLKARPEEIIACLNEIELPGHREPEDGDSSGLLKRNRAAMRLRLIQEALSPLFKTEAEILEEFAQLAPGVDPTAPYQLLYLSIDNYIVFSGAQEDRPRIDLLKYAAMNIVGEVVGERCACEVFDYEQGDMLAVLQCPGRAVTEAELTGCFQVIDRHLQSYFDARASACGSLEPDIGLSCLGERVRGLRILLEQRFHRSEGDIFFDAPAEMGHESAAVTAKTKALRELLEGGEVEAAGRCLEELAAIFCAEFLHPQLCRTVFLDILNMLREAVDTGGELRRYTDANGLSLYRGITGYDFSASILQALQGYLRAQAGRSGDLPARSRREIVEVKAYVRENLHRSLPISEVAGQVFMSNNYFSHVFKKETGLSFIDYVNQKRVDRAKRLLRTTDLRIYEVAEQVGIENPNYFGILFKKLTGKSPNEYRECNTKH